MTLIEAVVGMALLGSLLVGLLVAAGRLRAQSARAAETAQACEAAERLLAQWWQDRDGLPRQAEGAISDHPGWSWRMTTVQQAEADQLDGEVVALEIRNGDAADRPPLLRVELLLAKKERLDLGP